MSQLYDGMLLKPFPHLRAEFLLLPNHYFMYLQIWNAMRIQSRCSIMRLTDSDFLPSIFTTVNKKGILSHIYTCLLAHIQAPDLLPCREKWEADVGPIDGDNWEQILATGPLVSASASQKLSHLFILHRIYRTPVQLHK